MNFLTEFLKKNRVDILELWRERYNWLARNIDQEKPVDPVIPEDYSCLFKEATS